MRAGRSRLVPTSLFSLSCAEHWQITHGQSTIEAHIQQDPYEVCFNWYTEIINIRVSVLKFEIQCSD